MGLSNENLVTKYFVSSSILISSLYSLVMILVQMIAKLLAIYLILRAVPAINLCAFLSAGAARMENCWRTLIFQWIFVDGVEWKSLITEQSTIYDFTSTPSTNIHLNLNFRRFFLTVHAPHTTQSKLPAGQDLAKFNRSQNVLQNVRTCAQRCGMSLLGGGEVKP